VGGRWTPTRVRLLREQADRDVLVLGTHFSWPTAGRIVSDGAAFRFDVETPPSAR
jgi:hypothetical protein